MRRADRVVPGRVRLRASVLALAAVFACGAASGAAWAQSGADVAPATAAPTAPGAAPQPVLPPMPILREDTLSGAPLAGPRISAYTLQNLAVGEIVVDVDTRAAVADGVSRLLVTVRLNDTYGQPLKTPAMITIEASDGRIHLPGAGTDETGPGALDADRVTPGVQMTVEGGKATFWLIAPFRPHDVQLRISAGQHAAEGTISFAPEVRDMVAAGLVEGVIALRDKAPNEIQPVRIGDAFEKDIENWAKSFQDDKHTAAARGAFFLKGRIKGDALLTMAYDSEKDTQARLFRDVVPDKWYPVYGDASITGSDAQSSSKFYVRVDKDRSFLLYGDFITSASFSPVTPSRSGAPLRLRDLGIYSRTVTGAQGHVEDDKGYGNLFVLNQNLRQAIEEYAANGTSGPFAVRNSNAVLNSEKVELITRDRNNTAVILAAVPLAPMTDYVFEPFSGRILLNRPIPSRDERGNPLSLRITYEIDQGGDPFWVVGADGQYRITLNWEVGGTVVEDRNPYAPYRLGSANTGYRLGPNTTLIAEVARSEGTYNTGTGLNTALTQGLAGVTGEAAGLAGRVALEHDDGTTAVRLYAGRSEKEFNNPAASFTGGRGDAGVRATHQLTSDVTLFGEAIRSEDLAEGGTRTGVQVGSAFRITEQLTVDVALKHVDENGLPVTPGASIGANPSSNVGTSTSPLTPSGGFFGTGINALNPSTGTSILAPQLGSISSGAGEALEATTAQIGAQYRFNAQWMLAGEVEHSVTGDDQKRLALGAGYQMSERSRMYGRFETQRGLASSYSLNPADRSTWFVFGADTLYGTGTQLYSEYRIESSIGDALTARDQQLATGVRNTWFAAEGLRFVTGGEYLKALEGDGPQAVALVGGVDYTAHPLWRGMGRLEWRRMWTSGDTEIDQQQDSYMSTVTVARKLDRDWTLLARNYLLYTDIAATGSRWQDRFQIGAAYRDTLRNRVNALMKYEYLAENDESALPAAIVGTVVDPSERRVHIVSLLADWHPSRPWWLTGRLAGKTADETFTGVEAGRYTAALLMGRAIYDVTERFDVGVMGGYMYSPQGNARQSAYGFEVGGLVTTNLRVAVGFNVQGFSDQDLTGSAYTQKGLYLRLRFKFDEELLRSGEALFSSNASSSAGG